ncbi:hypothetical protein C8R43DRAFT_1201946 [Mycena crocata]|nr:hypothetical protein C8R43DRAFT_1201946 [Mycena crocata]
MLKMFLSPLATLCFATAALAAPRTGTGTLSIVLSSAQSAVNSIADIVINAAVTNTGADDIKVLKYGTVLDTALPTQAFTVTRNGSVIPFTGIKVTVSVPNLDDRAYTTVAPGQTVKTVHKVAELFNFASVGTGSFTFAPITTFHTTPLAHNISARPTLSTIQVLSSPITIAVTKDVGSHPLPQELPDHSKNFCADASKLKFIQNRREILPSRFTEMQKLGTISVNRIDRLGTTDALYKDFWGTNNPSNVKAVFNAVLNEGSGNVNYYCEETQYCRSEPVIAYAEFGYATPRVYFCNYFFTQVEPTRSVCRSPQYVTTGGVCLHELSHALANINDGPYDCEESKGLSDTGKLDSAFSYNCYSEAVYKKEECR